jgi:BirA family biotin operon repressor/biotin-[acetyl-CoA-carboxylase] ligase
MDCEKKTIGNAFSAPVFFVAETESTMEDAKILAMQGQPDGSAIYAGYQSAGRGRVEGRKWEALPGENLLCTVLLRRPPVAGFTLRVGLAVALTFDSFLGAGRRTAIKWPNDVLFDGKKLAGILCENDGSTLYVGTGLNVAQREFPGELGEKATSLARILNATAGGTATLPTVETVLERYLENLSQVLDMDDWNARITERLWKKGEMICFVEGDPSKNLATDGYPEGIGPAGELLFRPADGRPMRRIFSGEIPVDCPKR